MSEGESEIRGVDWKFIESFLEFLESFGSLPSRRECSVHVCPSDLPPP